jgi:hypothetical protein
MSRTRGGAIAKCLNNEPIVARPESVVVTGLSHTHDTIQVAIWYRRHESYEKLPLPAAAAAAAAAALQDP